MLHNHPLIILCIEAVLFVQIIYFFNSVLDRHARKPKRYPYFLLFGVLGYVYLAAPVSFIVTSILAVAVIFVLAQTYRVELRTKLIFTILYAVLMSIVNFISFYILHLLEAVDFRILNLVDEQDQLLLIRSTFLSFTIMFAVIPIIRLIAKRNSSSLHYRYYLLFMIIPVFSIYQLNVLTQDGEISIHFFISAIGFLFINVLVIFVLDTMVDKFQYKHENDRLQQQMDYQDESYEKTVHSFKSIKRIIHDTNQQFLYIEECIKQNQPEAAIQHIHRTLNKIESAYQRVNTGHLVIDALVTNTLMIGQANGIRVDTRLNLASSEIHIDRYDLCVVLGNMLDNALEASKQVKVAADRYVAITVFAKDSALFIHILNVMDQEKVDLQSRKPNPGFHGIGLTNIDRICDKHGGHMTIEIKNNTFHNMVMLPF